MAKHYHISFLSKWISWPEHNEQKITHIRNFFFLFFFYFQTVVYKPFWIRSFRHYNTQAERFKLKRPMFLFLSKQLSYYYIIILFCALFTSGDECNLGTIAHFLLCIYRLSFPVYSASTVSSPFPSLFGLWCIYGEPYFPSPSRSTVHVQYPFPLDL